MSANDEINIVVGKAGSWSTVQDQLLNATYNGGGSSNGHWTNNTSSPQYHGSGGGATHIATSSGLLSTLENNKEDIIMVAAGGGGGGYFRSATTNDYFRFSGGSGGGKTGTLGAYSATSGLQSYIGPYEPATQTTPSKIKYSNGTASGSFGKGSNGYTGGGGGYWGGAGSYGRSSGGSSYIGYNDLLNAAMYCYDCEESTELETFTVSTTGTSSLRDTTNCPSGYNSNPVSKCAKVGNGYARITWLGNE